MTGTYPGDLAVAYALKQLGKAYVLGGAGPAVFDCSGLAMRAWEAAGVGVELTHRAAVQFAETAPVFASHIGPLRPGDLVFYYGPPLSQKAALLQASQGRVMLPHHVGLFLGWHAGQRWCVQATQEGTPLEVIPMNRYARPSSFGRPRFRGFDTKHPTALYHGGAR